MEKWITYAEELFQISLNETQIQQFKTYETILMDWNSKINLTAVRDEEGIRLKHFLDSLSCAKALGNMNGKSLIDIGTGAGFPGIPLRILYPEMRLTLVDSVGKKVDFCQLAANTLHLKGTKALKARSEELGMDKLHREKYDAAVARAVAGLPVLSEYLLPLVKVGGVMLAQKGESGPEECKAAAYAIRKLGGGDPVLTGIDLPEVEGKRWLIRVPKVKATPQGFPRRTGLPLKKPLLPEQDRG